MDSIQKVKSRLGIVEVVGSYIDLKKSGKNYSAICPFHNEDTPSFMVSPELGIYKCFGCGASGDIFTFVQEMDGLEFYEALKKLADKAGVKLENAPKDEKYKLKKRLYKVNEKAVEFYNHLLLNHRAGKRGLDYLLQKRGLEKAVIEEFRLGYAPKNWDLLYRYLQRQGFKDKELVQAGVIIPRKKGKGYIDKFRGRVLFPLIDTTGKVQGFMGRTIFDDIPKYLNTSDTPIFTKSNFVFGLKEARVQIKKQGALFVEGPMDVASAFQHGVKNVVAPLGTSLTKRHLQIISRYTREVTFCFDSDTAGLEAIKRAVLMAEKQDLDVKVILIPEKYKDLDELLREDSDLAKDSLASSVSAFDFFVAYAFKKHSKTTAEGKKAIIKELAKVFSQVSEEITLEHYVKRLSKELNLSEEVIYSAFSEGADPDALDSAFSASAAAMDMSLGSTENYFLSLLLRAPKLDQIRPFLDLLAEKDFISLTAGSIFEKLKNFVDSSKGQKLDIKAFIDTINENLRESVKDLYLLQQEAGEVGSLRLEQELEEVSKRLQKQSAKRKIETLQKELELAEMGGNADRVRGITKKIKEYSKKLV